MPITSIHENDISVYIKVSVCYVIPYAYYINPWNFRTFAQQFGMCKLVDLLNAFADSFDEHAAGRKIFHSIR